MDDLKTLAALISAVGGLCAGLAALVSALVSGRRKRSPEKKRTTATTEGAPDNTSSNADAAI